MGVWDEEHALEWRRSFGSPARPTKAECKVYWRELSKLKKDAKTLLLGSTPEIRDMAFEFGMRLTVIDFKVKNYEELQGLMVHSPDNETYVNKNWIDMEFQSEFDVVIGDNVLSVLTTPKAKKLVKRIHAALKPEGKWITRVMLYDLGGDFISPDTLNGRIALCEKKQEIYENLYVPFLAYYKNEVGGVIGSEAYEGIKRDVGKGLFPPACIEVFNSLRFYKNESYLVDKSGFERNMKTMYDIERTIDNTEPFSKNWTIYVLKKK
ncbi:MAG: class I SAM-dependent methyltransferase [Candidatus Micrarchaeota archaeon]